MTLVAAGRNDSEISRATGICRATVRDCRSGARDHTVRFAGQGRECAGNHDFSSLPPVQYSYLLGLYLGDGYIASHARGVFRLRIVMDSAYPGIIDACCAAMEALMPTQRAYRQQTKSRCIVIAMYSKHWPCLFPQHGPGRKHERPIKLEPWQEVHVEATPASLIRGLIHSDGCRVVANDRGVASVRYHFSNRSEDIKANYAQPLTGWESRGRGRATRTSPSMGRRLPPGSTSSSAQMLAAQHGSKRPPAEKRFLRPRRRSSDKPRVPTRRRCLVGRC